MVESKSAPNSARKLFFGLFVFPLLIAVGMAVLLSVVVFLTNEAETPETLVAAIKSGSPSKRWQKAFELSNELNRTPDVLRQEGILGEIIHILQDPARYDAQTRSYMAMALAHFEDRRAAAALILALRDGSEDVRIYALWSLGLLGAREAAGDIRPLLRSERSSEKKMAAYILGVLGSAGDAAALRPLLEDPVPDVRWNAALGLARLGDASGRAVLLQMIDRRAVASAGGLLEPDVERIMVNGAKGLGLVAGAEERRVLQELAQSEKSLKVRQAAIDALKHPRESVP